MIISNQRKLFSIPEDITYMNCANMSPLPSAVEEAGIRAIEQRRHPWDISGDQWFGPAEDLRILFSRLIGADKEEVALIPSASYGLAIAKNNIKLKKGQHIIVLDQQYPSNIYAWRELAAETGAVIITVKREGSSWTEAVLQAINERTGLVAVPNCHWTDGSFIDLEQVSRSVKEIGAKLVIDVSQSLGAYPLDVRVIRPDFLVTVGYKWLMGPYNLAYLYADVQYLTEGKPIEFSWMAKAGSDDFTRVSYSDTYKPGARRFDAGEFASFIHIPMAIAGLEQVAAWGIGNIQESLSVLTDAIASGAGGLELEISGGEDRVGHMIGIRFSEDSIPELQKKLLENKIYISFRGGKMRIAPHLFNDERDVERLLAALSDFARVDRH